MRVWLIGSGTMSQSYAAVLKALATDFVTIGRGDGSAQAFEQACGAPVVRGGLQGFLASIPAMADAAIVSVGVEELAQTTEQLLAHGVTRILVEKPGALDLKSLVGLRDLAVRQGAQVLIGYNRRYFASVRKAQELAAADGGLQSCFFEFTEWGHEIETLTKGPGVKEHWLLSNSSHVIDLAFHLIGAPTQLNALTRGSLPWHTSASVFVGSGLSERSVPFAYHANWDAPGRWGVELLTRNLRMFLRPMEALQVMRRGSVAIEPMALDDGIDKAFKPGLYHQVSDFLAGRAGALCTIDEQVAAWPAYCRMGAYTA